MTTVSSLREAGYGDSVPVQVSTIVLRDVEWEVIARYTTEDPDVNFCSLRRVSTGNYDYRSIQVSLLNNLPPIVRSPDDDVETDSERLRKALNQRKRPFRSITRLAQIAHDDDPTMAYTRALLESIGAGATRGNEGTELWVMWDNWELETVGWNFMGAVRKVKRTERGNAIRKISANDLEEMVNGTTAVEQSTEDDGSEQSLRESFNDETGL